MSKQVLKAELREQTGKGICRRLRAAGRVPAVVYGKGIAPVSISLGQKELSEAIAGEGGRNHILTLECAGELNGASVIVADLLRDSLKNVPRHVDLHKINLADKVKVHVKLNLVGTPAGVKAGGFLDFAMHEVEVECLPVHIPAHINVDVAELLIGHSVHVGQIVAPIGTAILSDPKASVVSILGRKGAAEEEAAPAA
ncbi:ribosomal protein L25 [Citrifermentans bemidjiense Bem]|uniref:Large ribosomal subunit protein bL25 n=1 Tax=Citrifermentans bemidjiense (strain ATCC BAA-1014 / DSM 16622 / JCM 12645 / Bem) TaxID=404380 RepID=RL25_CITBB|nr:50S ribosomal protein L25 [Citrifermentans bemidjiense]B5EHX2.1 RecName: Full=Large ribosomal subunit protein bL25; AltName: Full=50S ribosomal protein L25; AltName: Full=General stress protein CTC [Citrifermentans bemidjiense Bem]ACH39771.1 ribosomal protein L25 [Citrifermentans bemidjiense Bem]